MAGAESVEIFWGVRISMTDASCIAVGDGNVTTADCIIWYLSLCHIHVQWILIVYHGDMINKINISCLLQYNVSFSLNKVI